ncbi:hypothetical protein DMENIID0001_165070 [Sergentomyia squamirostris]
MEETFEFRLNLSSLYIFFHSRHPTPKTIVRVDINFGKNSSFVKIPVGDLENFNGYREFSKKLSITNVSKFLKKSPVSFKFWIGDKCLGDSLFRWSHKIRHEICKSDFIVCHDTQIVAISKQDEPIGLFKLWITVAKAIIDEKPNSVAKGDVVFVIRDDKSGQKNEGKRGGTSREHKCVGGLINLSESSISNGDRVNLHRITLPNGQLGCPAVKSTEASDDKIKSSSSLSHNATPENHFAQTSTSDEDENDWTDSEKPQVMVSTKSGSNTKCSRLCDEVFGKKKQLTNDTATTCSSNHRQDLSVKDAVALIRGWGKMGKSKVHSNIMMTIEDEEEIEENCPELTECLKQLQCCQKDYDKEIEHHQEIGLSEMKFTYKGNMQNFRRKRKKKSSNYVKCPRYPIVHYTSHKYCALKTQLVPKNMSWKWNGDIVGLNKRKGWRPGYVHGQIKRLMDYFLMPLPYQPQGSVDGGTVEEASDSENQKDDSKDGRVITRKTQIQKNKGLGKNQLKIEIPTAVQSYVQQMGDKSKNSEVIHQIDQETQYNETDYVPWKKKETKEQNPSNINKIYLTIKKPSKLPKFKGNPPPPQQTDVKNPPEEHQNVKKPQQLKASGKAPKKPLKKL